MDRSWIPYCGTAPLPGELLARWNFDPWLLAGLTLAAAAAAWRGERRAGFWAGYGCLVLLFVSPLCAFSSALFSARVTHHVLLTAVAAPLLARSLTAFAPPGSAALWAALHVFAFWFWHAPGPYAAALSSDALYWLMQAALLGTALGFWSKLRGTQAPLAVALLLAMMVQMGLLGAILTFAGAPLYAPHFGTTAPWGLSPIEDQQLAGLIMWAPASTLYLAAALAIGWRLLVPPRAAVA